MEFTVFIHPMVMFIGLALAAYLLGSISSAILVCKVLGYPDPRTQGSNNPGATNVLRVAGRWPAVATLVGDVLKGVLPVYLAYKVGFSTFAAAWIGLAAFAGHLLPVFFDFQGGKGVATAFGVLFTLKWQLGFLAGFVWLVTFYSSRISSLASLFTFVVAPLCCLIWFRDATFPIALLSAALIARHQGNINNLLKGEELSFKK